jgi:endonuclease/exonuclease/phosphatase family metal-dependent hydrolase
LPENIIRIASYNAMNFFDDLNSQDAKPLAEIKALGKIIDEMKPSIVGLQEVESARSLQQLNNVLKHNLDWHGFIEGNSHRNINVPFMSQLPFSMTSHTKQTLKDAAGKVIFEFASRKDSASGKPKPLKFQRDLLLAEFSLPGGQKLAVFNTHLKSRLRKNWCRNDSKAIRTAESKEAARIVEEFVATYPKAAVVVLGDFNEKHKDKTITAITKDLGFSDPILEQFAGKNPTTYWKKKNYRIDYILLSPVAQEAYVTGSATIHESATARSASDHYPISIDLKF